MTSMVTHGKAERDRLAEGERMLSDRVNGMPVSQMMEKYDCSKNTVYRRIDQAIEARVSPTVDKYRELMNASYDEAMTSAQRHRTAALVLIEQGTNMGDPKVLAQGMAEHARALDILNRTREAQRKLNGLDMPVRSDVHVTVTTPIDTEIASLVGQLDDAPAA